MTYSDEWDSPTVCSHDAGVMLHPLKWYWLEAVDDV